jgi:hypothetical protein
MSAFQPKSLVAVLNASAELGQPVWAAGLAAMFEDRLLIPAALLLHHEFRDRQAHLELTVLAFALLALAFKVGLSDQRTHFGLRPELLELEIEASLENGAGSGLKVLTEGWLKNRHSL